MMEPPWDEQELTRRAKIDRYAVPGDDRSPPVVFAGRDRELFALDDMLTKATAGGEGLSTVVVGIPGSGKTSLMREFCRRAEARGCVAVRTDGPDVRSAKGIVDTVVARYRDDAIRRQTERIENSRFAALSSSWHWLRKKTKRLDAKVDAPVLKLGRSAPPADAPTRHLLREMPVPEGVPIVIVVDEAQGLPDSAGEIVAALHSGSHGRPILPVYAGLSHAAERLRRFEGMSTRLASGAVRTIGPLSDDEAATSVEGACREFGVDADTSRAAGRVLGKAAQGFPAHIASAVCAVAQTMQAHGYAFRIGDQHDDMMEADGRAMRMRSRYYRDCLLAADNPPTILLDVLASFARKTPDGWGEAAGPLADKYDQVSRSLAEREDFRRLRKEVPDLPTLLRRCETAGVLRTRTREADAATLFQFVAPSMANEIEGLASGRISHHGLES